MPPPDWSSIQERSKKKKIKKRIKIKAKQIQKREKIDKEIKGTRE